MGIRRRSTLRDVAQRAGVSVGTASGVFSSNPSVSASARDAVLRAASQIGYRPRRRPGQPAANGISTLGALSRSDHYVGPANPFYGPVLYGVQLGVAELGLALVSEMLPEEEPARDGASGDGVRGVRGLPLLVERRQAQGLLVLGPLESDYLRAVLQAGMPCVLVDHRCEDPAVDSVCADDYRGGYLATRHLVERGHHDPVPATITGPQDAHSIRARLRGYRQALLDAGLEPDESYVRTGRLTADSGREAMADLLDLPRPPTAVFCCNDDTALGVLAVLRERGIAVPGEVSVIGYDDVAMASHGVPPLTTIAVDKELLGMQAVWNLVQRIGHPDMAVRDTTLQVRLVERGSTSTRRDA